MLLSIIVLVVILPLVKSNLVQENTTLIERCNDDMQKTIVNKIELLQSGIDNLKFRLNTLNIIIDQLFEELKAALVDIPRTEIAATPKSTEYSCSFATDKQCDALESTKPIQAMQAKQTDTSNLIPSIPSNCQGHKNGTHLLKIPNSKLEPFLVYCIQDPQAEGNSWILIQRRSNGKVDFYRSWSEYQHGFGYLHEDFFIGLEKLYALTRYTLHELWIEIESFGNETFWARYSSFAIGDESESYALNVLGSFTGNAGDSLDYHAGQKFTTKDMDNDMVEDMNCAVTSAGGWWYKDCYQCNLNGIYYEESYGLKNYKPAGSPIVWKTWHSYSLLKYVHMAIRPLGVNNKQV